MTSKTFMNPETNQTNITNLKLILEHWYLDNVSHNHIINCLDDPPQIATEVELGEDNRLWSKVDITTNTDVAYQEYKRCLQYRWDGTSSLDYIFSQNTRNVIKDLMHYEVWKEGKYEGTKLFKFILKHKILNEECIERITTARNTSQLYLCLSKNPIDFLFMATNQSFSSCMSLRSNYSAAYYMGIPEQWADHHKYILFLTPGKLRRYTIKGREFKHFRMIQRSIVVSNGHKKGIINNYPNTIIHMEKCAPEWWHIEYPKSNSYQSYKTSIQNPQISFENGEDCVPYNDCTRHHSGYTIGSSSGSRIDFCWSNGFEAMDSIYNYNQQRCTNCDELFRSDAYHTENGIICEYCNDNYFYTCQYCNERVHEDNCEYIEELDDYYCVSCIEDMTECVVCDSSIGFNPEHSDIHGDYYCQQCYDDKTIECNKCYERFPTDETYNLYDETFCENCKNDFISASKNS